MWIELDGAVNVRDLGGLPLTDGTLTTAHRLIRADNLQGLSQRDVRLLVDEYQDVNPLQVAFVDALRPDGRGVTAVGDDAQAIYGFRAATTEAITEFPARHPGAELHLVIGAEEGGQANLFEGSIAEVAIYATNLSQTQISSHYKER